MLVLRAFARRVAGIALAAMLLAALAPTVSHALARARPVAPTLLDVCSVAGSPGEASQHGTPIAGDSTPGKGSVPSLNHCPFCLHIADRLGPPPAASLHFFNAESGLAPPDVQALFFELLPPPAPLPRGPPLHA